MRVFCKSKALADKITGRLKKDVISLMLDSKHSKSHKFPVWEADVPITQQFTQRHNIEPSSIVDVALANLSSFSEEKGISATTDLEFELNLPMPLQQQCDDFRDNEWDNLNITPTDPFRSNKTRGKKMGSGGDGGGVPRPQDVLVMREEGVTEKFEMRIFSIDIECVSYNADLFPCAYDLRDKGICICGVVNNTKAGTKQGVVFTTMPGEHKDFKQPDGQLPCIIKTCDTELDMYLQFAFFIVDYDIDIVTGWNSENFDFQFMYKRVMLLDYFSPFFFIGRTIARRCEMVSDLYYHVATYEVWGRQMLDALPRVVKKYKFTRYTLAEAAPVLTGGQQKIDLPHKVMFEYYASNDPKLHDDILTYCMQDAALPDSVWEKQGFWSVVQEDAIVTGLWSKLVWNCGESKKVFSVLFRKAKKNNFVFESFGEKRAKKDKFAGANVLDAQSGHWKGVATLDVVAMYPSIFLNYNICYSTYVPPNTPLPTGHVVTALVMRGGGTSKAAAKQKQKKNKGPNTSASAAASTITVHSFIQASEHITSIIPSCVADLLSVRGKAKKAKAAAAAAGDKLGVMKYDAKQLAVKQVANSVYGFTGASVGFYGFVAIASSITGFGRAIITDTKTIIEVRYAEYGAVVIYGDTDSVMIYFAKLPFTLEGIKKRFEVAHEIADVINAKRVHVKFEVEKVYLVYYLIKQKNYAGIKAVKDDFERLFSNLSAVTMPKNQSLTIFEIVQNETQCPTPLVDLIMQYCIGAPKIDIDQKGVMSVKRDFCAFQQRIGKRVVNMLVFDLLTQPKNVVIDNVLAYVEKELLDMVNGLVPIADFVKTQKLRAESDYKVSPDNQSGWVVSRKMNERSFGSGYLPGQRVPFVMTKPRHNMSDAAAEAADDPVWVEQNKIPINCEFYMDHTWTPILSMLQAADKSIDMEKYMTKKLSNVLRLCTTSPGQKSLKDVFTAQAKYQSEGSLWRRPPTPPPKKEEEDAEDEDDDCDPKEEEEEEKEESPTTAATTRKRKEPSSSSSSSSSTTIPTKEEEEAEGERTKKKKATKKRKIEKTEEEKKKGDDDDNNNKTKKKKAGGSGGVVKKPKQKKSMAIDPSQMLLFNANQPKTQKITDANGVVRKCINLGLVLTTAPLPSPKQNKPDEEEEEEEEEPQKNKLKRKASTSASLSLGEGGGEKKEKDTAASELPVPFSFLMKVHSSSSSSSSSPPPKKQQKTSLSSSSSSSLSSLSSPTKLLPLKKITPPLPPHPPSPTKNQKVLLQNKRKTPSSSSSSSSSASLPSSSAAKKQQQQTSFLGGGGGGSQMSDDDEKEEKKVKKTPVATLASASSSLSSSLSSSSFSSSVASNTFFNRQKKVKQKTNDTE